MEVRGRSRRRARRRRRRAGPARAEAGHRACRHPADEPRADSADLGDSRARRRRPGTPSRSRAARHRLPEGAAVPLAAHFSIQAGFEWLYLISRPLSRDGSVAVCSSSSEGLRLMGRALIRERE